MPEHEEFLNKIIRDDVVDLLSTLVKIPSENYRPDQTRGGTAEICEFLLNTFTHMGFDAVETQKTSFPGEFNVIGRIKGTGGGSSLLLNAHMDTVPADDMPDPFTPKLIDGNLYGRGACDNKQGLATMIIACKALINSNIELKGDLVATAVTDEEVTHEGIATLIKSGTTADYAVVLEGTNLNISYAGKGKAEFQIETHGKSAHAARPELGINAIVKMAKIISTLDLTMPEVLKKKIHPELGSPKFTIVNIHGGVFPVTLSKVPEQCKIEIDRRLIPGETYDEATNEIKDVLAKLKAKDPELQAELRLTDEVIRFPRLPFQVSVDSKIVTALSEASKEAVGRKPKLTIQQGYGDTNALVNKGGMPAVTFGPSSPVPSAHSDHEHVSIDQVIDATKIIALTAMKM